jgi:hypothetical protein
MLIADTEMKRRAGIAATRPSGRTMPLANQLGRMAWLRIRHPRSHFNLIGFRYDHGIQCAPGSRGRIESCHFENTGALIGA